MEIIENKKTILDSLSIIITEFETRLNALEGENVALRARIEELERSITVPGEKKAARVLGFSLARDKKGYWYACRRIPGRCKNETVYIGRDISRAEEKIRAKQEQRDSEMKGTGIQKGVDIGQTLLTDIRDYYNSTYWKHQGVLKIGELLDHLEARGYLREWAREQIIQMDNKGEVTLHRQGGRATVAGTLEVDGKRYTALRIDE